MPVSCFFLIVFTTHISLLLTRLVVRCSNSYLHHHLCPLHAAVGWGDEVDETPPEVPHLHHLLVNRKALTHHRCSFQLISLADIISLTANLDLREEYMYSVT